MIWFDEWILMTELNSTLSHSSKSVILADKCDFLEVCSKKVKAPNENHLMPLLFTKNGYY
jgi:hypothetical protein